MINILKVIRLLVLFIMMYYSLYFGYCIAIEDTLGIILSGCFLLGDACVILILTDDIIKLQYNKLVYDIKQEIINIQIQKLKDSLK